VSEAGVLSWCVTFCAATTKPPDSAMDPTITINCVLGRSALYSLLVQYTANVSKSVRYNSYI